MNAPLKITAVAPAAAAAEARVSAFDWQNMTTQLDGFGNAVSPQVGTWIGLRLRAVRRLRGVPGAAGVRT